MAIELKEVDRYEFYAGFLKSSPKVTVFARPPKRSSLHHRVANTNSPRGDGTTSPARADGIGRPPAKVPASTATWVCTICSLSNPVPVNFDPTIANAHTPLPPCLSCGIKPSLTLVLKAAINNANSRHQASPSPPLAVSEQVRSARVGQTLPSGNFGDISTSTASSRPEDASAGLANSTESFQCPRCTFSNHPSLLSCEICGAPLISRSVPQNAIAEPVRIDSPGPEVDKPTNPGQTCVESTNIVKISFRGGGYKIFYERLKGSMTQRKWLLHNAPPAPKNNRMQADSVDNGNLESSANDKTKTAGIAGLEQLGLSMRKNNEILIGSAFEDLEALMASAKDVIALAESFARQTKASQGSVSVEENSLLAESASQLGLITTKDIVGGESSESLYLSELSRNLAEFLTDDARGLLKKAGGIITLVDLWAMFNRARGGVELVSPMDFEKAVRLWEQLKLPLRLRTFRSGVMVVQGHDRTDEVTIKTLLSWLEDLHEFPPEVDVSWDWHMFGRGVTAQEAAERFGWSNGVAEEELLMAEEHGALCREEGLEGLKFWKNYICENVESVVGLAGESQAKLSV